MATEMKGEAGSGEDSRITMDTAGSGAGWMWSHDDTEPESADGNSPVV